MYKRQVLDRMNLDFVKAESGSMVAEAVEKETAPEKTENQMEMCIRDRCSGEYLMTARLNFC